MADRDVSECFVGREGELSTLLAALSSAEKGSGSLWLITGEAGIGKTRLAAQLAERADTSGAMVLRSTCWQGDVAPAFWPWRQLVRSALRRSTTSGPIQEAAKELAPVLPELAPPSPTPPGEDAVVDAGARFRLFESVAAVLRKLADEAPVVGIFDDLHAADLPSLMLLHFVAAELAHARVLFLCTYRAAEIARAAPVAEALSALARVGHEIPLQGLTIGEAASFIESTTGRAADAEVVAALHARSNGNPLFLSEIVRLHRPTSAAPTWDRDAIAASPASPSMRAVIRERCDRLSDACRRMLDIACVAGMEVEATLIQDVLAAPDLRHVLPLIQEAVKSGIVCLIDGGSERFRFAHPLLREVGYEELGMVERAHLHEAIGTALERRIGTAPEANYAEIADHFDRAATAPALVRTVDFATRAAEQARASLGYEKAAVAYRQALASLERIPVSDSELESHRRRRCALLLALGEVQLLTADKLAARRSFSQATTLARTLAATDLLARAAIGFAGGADAATIRDGDAVSMLEEALRDPGSQEPALRARLLSRLATTLSLAEPSRAAELSRQAVGEAERCAAPALLASVLGARRYVLLGPDDSDERARTTARIIALAERLDDRNLRCGGEFWRLLDHMERGDGAECDAALARYGRWAGELRQPFLIWRARVLGATRLMLAGRFSEAELAITDALALGERARTPNATLVYGIQLLELRRQQGRLAEVAPWLDEFASAHVEIPAIRCGIALLWAELGHHDAARSVLEDFRRTERSWLPRDGAWLGAVSALAHIAAILREQDAVPLLYEQLLPHAERCVVIGYGDLCQGAVARSLALLAQLGERWDAARGHFETALALNRRLSARALVARVQHEYAAMLLTYGGALDRSEAPQHLRESIATFESLGLASDASRARALAESPELRTQRNKAESAPGAVSGPNVFRRERELWLVDYEGKAVRLRDRRGLLYIAQLLREPGRELHVADLAGSGCPPTLAGDVAVPDARAKAAYRTRLTALEDEASEAERFNDPVRASRAREEAERLRDELAGRYGLAGGRRMKNVELERLRKAVAKCVHEAIAQIDVAHPALGRHLRLSVKTGVFCSYITERPVVWLAD